MSQPQYVTLIRERSWENESWINHFIVSSDNPEQKLRDAVKEYLQTDDGKKMIEATSYDFNWGDAINYVPDEIWEKHGVKPVYESQAVTITVDQDEVLIP